MFKKLAAITLFAALCPSSMAQAATADPQSLLDEMSRTANSLSGYRVKQVKRERVGDKLLPPETMTITYSRGRVYLHITGGPKQGAEAIYVPGWNGNKVRIHKGSFPDVTLNLDPHGSLLMDDQHHPIEHAGFDHLASTLLGNVRRAKERGEGQMRLAGETQVDGRPADVIELTTPWRTSPYVVQKGEDLWGLSRRLGVDPYVLLHENGLKRPSGLRAGATIQVPVYYGSRTVLAIDRASHLPSRLEVYDGKGRLYESYEWTGLDTRTQVSGADFDPGNPSYRF